MIGFLLSMMVEGVVFAFKAMALVSVFFAKLAENLFRSGNSNRRYKENTDQVYESKFENSLGWDEETRKGIAAIIAAVLILAFVAFGYSRPSLGTETMDVKVDQSGTVSKYVLTTNVSEATYNEMSERLDEKIGVTYEDVARDYSDIYREIRVGSDVSMIYFKVPTDTEDMSLTCTNGYCVYDHRMETNEGLEFLAGSFDCTYYLEMPGKIVESNADSVYGNKAEWYYSSTKRPNIHAKSII